MRIGILTYYRVPNFGANLQAISTYYCLKKLGHEIVFLNYASPRTRFIQRRVSGNRFLSRRKFFQTLLLLRMKFHVDNLML